MTLHRCPHCGEYVPSTSKKCPKCYRTVPECSVDRREYGRPATRNTGEKSKTFAFLLALVPGIIGLQGLGLIYLNYRRERGWYFLIVGLILFLSLLACASWWDSVGSLTRVLLIFAMIVLALIYISSYLAQLAETRLGSVFRMFRL